MGFVNVDLDMSIPGTRARVRVKCSVRRACMIRLYFHLGHGSDVR